MKQDTYIDKYEATDLRSAIAGDVGLQRLIIPVCHWLLSTLLCYMLRLDVSFCDVKYSRIKTEIVRMDAVIF